MTTARPHLGGDGPAVASSRLSSMMTGDSQLGGGAGSELVSPCGPVPAHRCLRLTFFLI